jgi:hypothetical protein
MGEKVAPFPDVVHSETCLISRTIHTCMSVAGKMRMSVIGQGC